MKRVVIVRHAKAVPYGYEDDFNRDLTDRGKRDAALVATELQKRGIMPGIIVSSPGKRALKTARIFAGNLGFDKDAIQENEDLYHGLIVASFLKLIRSLPENAKTVFFFGHNPHFYNFTAGLLRDYNFDMPTCTATGIDFDVESWQDVKPRSGKMAFRIIPAMLR